mmetsp:Transcript_48461/g.128354  ORF Transcript_48461/g.128354 Transcript_48461/m.128354 type:complete len:98 (-) Transcript_48461:719-1012(-)
MFSWTSEENVPVVPVRDIFLGEYKVLGDSVWRGFYLMAVAIFMTSSCFGWGKLALVNFTVMGMWGLPQPLMCAFSRDSSTTVRAPHVLGESVTRLKA